ncbi:hypothetical protein L873DRAFT_1833056 [Choiromyces venosus 120613-1]|uniref:Uncharacterized protein n=1 Tax=Choiromyces venosus 120613-1 TaxID=1336337 RepID=A0A3N4K209_9PEZI|nr:hypothetical protein L873DRAFT_1833056 [Choiromyces venosus 120613-1]
MKSSFITFISLFFFLICSAIAAPTTLDSTEIVKRESLDVDGILTDAYNSVVTTNTAYNATATATISDVTRYCNDIAIIIQIAIDKCGKLPSGHTYLDINIIVNILINILVQINFTLTLLLSRCGLLGGLLAFIPFLVGGLITSLNRLFVVIAGVCGPGLLSLCLSIIINIYGSNFLLLLLGLNI